MKCSRMHLSDRRYKPPPKISKSENVMPIIRPCIQSALTELPQRFSSVRSYSVFVEKLNEHVFECFDVESRRVSWRNSNDALVCEFVALPNPLRPLK
ncbi:CLUMA_CG018488, isoform A [Clunio marinus]|uniref:CLUMA_CG018488, isoform A n=1 Tax=Clunio marinus TaxID=568069 RepID=A0A1J1J2G9_9DIPT|nr:CLUMA_CG018488, isoform A [Clunio marinus]